MKEEAMRAARVGLTLGLGIGLICTWAIPFAKSAEPSTGPVVRLPPLLVESSTGQPWLYCEVDGFEILSRCSQATTKQLVHAFVRANQGLSSLLPSKMRLCTDAPQLLLLYDAALWPKARQEALAQMLLARAPLPKESALANVETTIAFEAAKSPSPEKSVRENTVSDRVYHLTSTELDTAHVRRSESRSVGGYVLKTTVGSEDHESAASPDFFSNIRLSDADVMGTFAIVSGQDIDDSRSAVTYEAVAQVLAARVPRLPSWFIAGFLSMYAQVQFGDEGLVAPRMNSSAAAELERSFPSLRDFLYDDNSASRNPSQWIAQAELLVRWGLDPREKRDQAFWKFVDRPSADHENESAFAECFGLTFAQANADLGRYLSVAKRRNIVWPRPKLPDHAIELREASRNEIARIRGEWERLETRYVRKNLPNEEFAYLTQARRTVGGAYARGDRDPRLAATFGLLQLEAGDKGAAQSLLEEATSSSVARPRAYFELAKIRYEEALNRTHRNDGKIDGSDLAGIVDLLASATTKSPPLLGIYELLADVWANAAIEPSPTQLAVIGQGLSVFATEPELHYRAAALYRKLGDFSHADSLAEEALKFAQPQLASEIREFREQLAAVAKKE